MLLQKHHHFICSEVSIFIFQYNIIKSLLEKRFSPARIASMLNTILPLNYKYCLPRDFLKYVEKSPHWSIIQFPKRLSIDRTHIERILHNLRPTITVNESSSELWDFD